MHIGRQRLHYDSVDSTNRVARSHAVDCGKDGLVVTASVQTAGRGRRGRRWEAAAGSSVLMSVLLFPPTPLRRPVILTALAGVSVCRTIQSVCGLQATLKWPNDVMIQGKKISGILVECDKGAVIGIGVNVRTTEAAFVAAGLPNAGSLSMFTSEACDVNTVCDTLIEQLDIKYQPLLRGDSIQLQTAWRECLGLQDRPVVLCAGEQITRGQVVELTLDRVTLQLPDGERRSFAPEAIDALQNASTPTGDHSCSTIPAATP